MSARKHSLKLYSVIKLRMVKTPIKCFGCKCLSKKRRKLPHLDSIERFRTLVLVLPSSSSFVPSVSDLWRFSLLTSSNSLWNRFCVYTGRDMFRRYSKWSFGELLVVGVVILYNSILKKKLISNQKRHYNNKSFLSIMQFLFQI